MAAIRAKDTKPELIVRRLVHALGYRYRLHRAHSTAVIPAPARETRGKNGGDPVKPIVSKEPLARMCGCLEPEARLLAKTGQPDRQEK